jgi:16S rRNA (cytosine967-C5)-methyltransferase
MNDAPRLVTTRILDSVIVEHHSLDQALAAHLSATNAESRSFVQAQCYGVLRNYEALQATVQGLLSKPLKKRDQDIHCLLLAGVYELWNMHTPAHACVSESVEVCIALGKPWAKGMVNAVLRRAQRETTALQVRLEDDPTTRLCLPMWLLRRLQTDWPDHWEPIAEALHQPPPMTLRVNLQRCRREDYLGMLARAGIKAFEHPLVASAIELETARDVSALPGFDEGLVSVQDAAAQLAAPLLAPSPGERVLDACAAPGGKTGHLAEYQPQLEQLCALDIDAKRVARIEQNLRRLQLKADVRVGDAALPETWWDGRPFDRILLDAPCSATGVIRRHPDIKRLRRASDIPALAQRQAALLDALWPLLGAGGMLLYVTCSVLKAENSERIGQFLAAHDDARHRTLTPGAGIACEYGQQILPGEQAMDGFYYAALFKV